MHTHMYTHTYICSTNNQLGRRSVLAKLAAKELVLLLLLWLTGSQAVSIVFALVLHSGQTLKCLSLSVCFSRSPHAARWHVVCVRLSFA